MPKDADLILVSHGHEEARKHAVALLNKSEKDECKIACIYEVADFFRRGSSEEKERTELYNCKRMNKGGSLEFPSEEA